MNNKIKTLFIIASTLFLFHACSPDKLNPNRNEESSSTEFNLVSSAFKHNGEIPVKHTCQGRDVSVSLSWSNQPRGTKSFAIIMDDPDAKPVVGYTWVHWIAYNIPGSASSLPENLPKKSVVKIDAGDSFTQGNTSWKQPGYGGPCPPKGTGVHHYYFKLYALKEKPALPPGLTKEKLLNAIEKSVIEKTNLIGTYSN